MFSEIRHTNKSLQELVSEEIEKFIVTGSFKPGDKIPNEFNLASMLGVGRSTIREAVRSLKSRNILEVRRGDGTYVCEHLGLTDDPLGLRFMPKRRKLGLDLCEIRFMIEPQIVALAAQKATEQEIEQMQRLCDVIVEKILKGENYSTVDVQLHTLWAASTRNSVMPNLIPIINQSIPLFIDLTKQSLQEQTIQTHQAIVDSIRARDADSASEAMKVHLRYNAMAIESLAETHEK